MSKVKVYTAKEFDNLVCPLSDIMNITLVPFAKNIYIKTDDDEQEELALGIEFGELHCLIRSRGHEESCTFEDLYDYMYDYFDVI